MLNCMATYRCADKKPHDNITEEPTISQISSPNSAIADIWGGGLINMLIKKNGRQSVDCPTAAIVGINETDNGNSTIEEIAGTRINGFTGTTAISKFLIKPAGKGKVLCPSAR